MKTFFDTSVLVAAVVEAHPMHPRALPWLQRAKAQEFDSLAASHTLAELYAVLTTLPVRPRIAPAEAWQLVHENIEQVARIVSLTPTEYSAVIKQLSERGLTGGITYDALLARAAQKSGAERFLTLNPGDFRRIWPEGGAIIIAP